MGRLSLIIPYWDPRSVSGLISIVVVDAGFMTAGSQVALT